MKVTADNSQRVLVTGGSGFIGSHLRNRLVARGMAVTVLDLIEPRSLSPGERFVVGDVRNSRVVQEAMRGADVVYHLAAAHHDFGIAESTFETVNVDGMRVVCEAAAANGVERLLFTSTVAVYGQGTPGASESTSPAPASPYGRTKLEAEQVLRAWAAQSTGRVAVVLRPAVVYGPNSFANMFSLVRQIERGRFALVGPGSNVKSIVYVDNLLDTMDFVLERTPAGTVNLFNAVDAPDLTSREIATVLACALGRKRIPEVPLGLARLLALPFDMGTALTGRDLGFSTARLEKFALQETRFSGAAVRSLGYEQKVSAEEGLRAMARWYADHGQQVSDPPRHLPPADVVV